MENLSRAFKTVFLSGMLVSVIAFSSTASGANAEEESSLVDEALKQLGRGISNVSFGIFEVPVNMYVTQEEKGEPAGITTGLLRGIWRCSVREVVGVIEIATFPLGLEPIVNPPYPSEHGILNAVYVGEDRYTMVPEDAWKLNWPRFQPKDME